MDRAIEFASNHWMMISATLMVVVLLLQDIIETLLRKYKTITAVGVVGLMNQDDCLVVDVREPDEYANGHIEGAMLISLNRLTERMYELEARKAKPIVIVCQSGTRSPNACNILVKNGFTQVYNLGGGMQEWEDTKLPVTSKKKK
ncbi:MAG: rhodanese-like domain-containing protein [Methylococcaceae bacterium]|nr:MAG: rhodanese-like domain-containing protein [Methylococcaceae bacterium]